MLGGGPDMLGGGPVMPPGGGTPGGGPTIIFCQSTGPSDHNLCNRLLWRMPYLCTVKFQITCQFISIVKAFVTDLRSNSGLKEPIWKILPNFSKI